MSNCKVINCDCNVGSACKDQDIIYGKHKRVANIDTKGKAKCTCCGKEER